MENFFSPNIERTLRVNLAFGSFHGLCFFRGGRVQEVGRRARGGGSANRACPPLQRRARDRSGCIVLVVVSGTVIALDRLSRLMGPSRVEGCARWVLMRSRRYHGCSGAIGFFTRMPQCRVFSAAHRISFPSFVSTCERYRIRATRRLPGVPDRSGWSPSRAPPCRQSRSHIRFRPAHCPDRLRR